MQVGVSHLYTSLGQFGPLCQLLSGVDVGVVCPLEGLLELLQLLRREGGTAASLFPLQGQVWLRLYIWTLVRTITCVHSLEISLWVASNISASFKKNTTLFKKIWCIQQLKTSAVIFKRQYTGTFVDGKRPAITTILMLPLSRHVNGELDTVLLGLIHMGEVFRHIILPLSPGEAWGT